MTSFNAAFQAIETHIREDERRKLAAELLRLHERSGKALQPGLWYAATVLDPSVLDGTDCD